MSFKKQAIKTVSQSDSSFYEAKEENNKEFRKRVAVQQFMNHNSPIFSAFAKKGLNVNDVIKENTLLSPSQKANELAKKIASQVYNLPESELNASQIHLFRTQASEYISAMWMSNKNFDMDYVAHEFAESVKVADKDWDYDYYKDDKLTGELSVLMTASSVAGTLMQIVEVYSFRMDKQKVAQKLISEVIKNADQIANTLFERQNTEKSHFHTVMQTISRNLGNLMAACYERKITEIASFLEKSAMSDDEKEKWLIQNKPLDDILENFQEWSTCFGAFTNALTVAIDNEKKLTEKKDDQYNI